MPRKSSISKEKAIVQNWVSDLLGSKFPVKIQCIRQDWGTLQFGRSIEEWPLKLNGKVYDQGLGTHAASELKVSVPGGIKRFQALVGQDDNVGTRERENRILFAVAVNGRHVWQSPPMAVSDAPASVDVDLGGAKEFTLLAWEEKSKIICAHADWVEPKVTLEDGTVLPMGMQSPLFPMVPISFQYGNEDSSDFLPRCERKMTTKRLTKDIVQHQFVYTDPATGLRTTLEMKVHDDFAAVEWVTRFKNTGSADTPILQNIQSMDLAWMAAGEPVLRYAKGSTMNVQDFLPQHVPLKVLPAVHLHSEGGRSSDGCLPFFNVIGKEEGFIMAVGWTGQWAADFDYSSQTEVRVRAGMEKTHLTLHPGEEIRTPSGLLLYWTGEALTGHNQLRRFILKHHTYRPDGKTIPPHITQGSWGGLKTDKHLARIAEIGRQKLDYDFYWVDAGWFGTTTKYMPQEDGSDWYSQAGTWTPNPMLHPAGMKPIADAARKAGMKFLLWVEPERATANSAWAQEHPEWFLKRQGPSTDLLLNLGIPQARQWLTDFISKLIKDYGIGCYRQDFNFPPLAYWREADAPDRQGMTEIRYIEGLYAFWDELLRRHKGLFIDNCASGGRRLDLETTSRSIPLCRTDYNGAAPGNSLAGPQSHTMGLAYWLPLSGTGSIRLNDDYHVRSAFCTGLQFPIGADATKEVPKDYPWKWHKKILAELHRVSPLFMGDFYPLTPCSVLPTEWLAFQMHREDQDAGFILAFRREAAPFISAQFALRGLSPKATYIVEDADTGKRSRVKGKTLIEQGLSVQTKKPRESRLIFYKKAK